MFFPFTFSISTPANPFAESADPGQIDYASPTRTRPRRPPPVQRPSLASTAALSQSEGPGLSRKRGRWSPDLKGPACSPTTDLTSTSAYIDSPTKYVQVDRADAPDDQDANNELRPAKRRRIVEITDSLISTAFSAAVIGTAVGLTAYRLWRDRGKEGSPPAQVPQENFPPPPPYTERPEQPVAGPSYVPGSQPSLSAASTTATPVSRRTPARPGTGSRRTHMQSSRRKRPVSTVFQRNQSPAASFNHNRHQSTTSYHTAYTNPSSARSTPGPSSSSYQPNTGVQSGDELDDDEMEMSGQMDWMSSKLQDLINQGKKALGTEIVVGGAEDADDGCDGWDDAEPVTVAVSRAQSSTGSGTTSRAATRTPILGRSSSRASGASRRKVPRVSSGSISGSSIRKHTEDEDLGFEVLYQSPMQSAPSTKTSFDDDGTSEELRVAMERVRKAYGLR